MRSSQHNSKRGFYRSSVSQSLSDERYTSEVGRFVTHTPNHLCFFSAATTISCTPFWRACCAVLGPDNYPPPLLGRCSPARLIHHQAQSLGIPQHQRCSAAAGSRLVAGQPSWRAEQIGIAPTIDAEITSVPPPARMCASPPACARGRRRGLAATGARPILAFAYIGPT